MKTSNKYSANESLFELNVKELDSELKSWKRNQIIDWLCWNDPSGIYTDKDSKQEGFSKLTKQVGIEIIERHVMDRYTGRKLVFVAKETFQELEQKQPVLIHNQKNWPRIVSL